MMNKPQRVLNAAARVVSGTHKFDDRGLSRLLHIELHWLDVPERVVYKLVVMVFNCLHGQAPQYLVELCQPVAGVASRHHLRSATRQLLVVPRHPLSFYGRRVFCVAGPLVRWQLAESGFGGNSFRQSLKTFLFATYWCIRGFTTMRYINRLFTYLLATSFAAATRHGGIVHSCGLKLDDEAVRVAVSSVSSHLVTRSTRHTVKSSQT